LRIWGIRVARFPGEQCWHHERVAWERHIRAADVVEIGEVAKICAGRIGDCNTALTEVCGESPQGRAKADTDRAGIAFAEDPQRQEISKESVQ
jgi:hypothetical protein